MTPSDDLFDLSLRRYGAALTVDPREVSDDSAAAADSFKAAREAAKQHARSAARAEARQRAQRLSASDAALAERLELSQEDVIEHSSMLGLSPAQWLKIEADKRGLDTLEC